MPVRNRKEKTSGVRKRFRKNPNAYPPSKRKGAKPNYASANAYAHFKVFKDPFSNAKLDPRIPDGRCIASQGLKIHHRQEFTLPGFVNGDGGTLPYTMLLQPCLTTPLVIYSANKPGYSSDVLETGIVETSLAKYRIDGPLAGGTFALTNVNTSDKLTKWRVVSYGLHITLLNNAEENDGWWEGYRINTDMDPEQWAIHTPPNSGDIWVPEISRRRAYVADVSSEDIVNQRSYCSGRLRDIHNITFSLRPDGNDHDFADVRHAAPQFDTSEGDWQNWTGANEGSDWTSPQTGDSGSDYNYRPSERAPSMNFRHGLVDKCWDSVAVRIHGRTQNVSKILVHVVQNIEIIYDHRAMNSRFHTRAPLYAGFDNQSKAHSQMQEAAVAIT
jgi:hypothetical protein